MKMFWGLILEPGKKYEQKAEASFHLTMAALEPSTKAPAPNKPTVTSLVVESSKNSYILCNLDQQRVLQQPLDLVFTEDEPISFFVNGENKIHLTGYIMPDSDIEDSEDMYDFDGSEEDSEAEEMLAAMNDKKRKQAVDPKDANKKVKFGGGDEPQAPAAKAEKKQEKAKPAKAGKNDVQAKANQKPKAADLGDDDDDDDEDDDEESDEGGMSDLLDQFDDDDDEEDDEDDEDMDDSSPEAKKPVKSQPKQQNNQKGTPAKLGQPAKPQQNQNNKQGTPKAVTPQQNKGFQGGKQQWSGGKNKGPQNNYNKNQNSGKKGTPGKFGGSPGNKNKKPWQNKK